jgi:hypothetical protein
MAISESKTEQNLLSAQNQFPTVSSHSNEKHEICDDVLTTKRRLKYIGTVFYLPIGLHLSV